MSDYEIVIREIKDTLKKMQEDIKRLEDNMLSLNHPTVNIDEVPPTQACSLEDLERCVI